MATGRPKKEINWDLVELYLKSGCTQVQICKSLHVSPDVMQKRIQEKYGFGFTALADALRSEGEILIVAQQFQKAMKGYWPALLWLGKVLAGQKEPDNIQLLAANQGAIDQSHRIMMLEHQLEEIKANGVSDNRSSPTPVKDEPEAEPIVLRVDASI